MKPFPPSVVAFAALLLAGCGSVSVWPFGESGPSEVRRDPANATEYRCDGGRKFFVRPIDASAVWLIAPDREIRLARVGGADSNRYGAGRVALEVSGQTATLVDPPTEFRNCKVPGAEKPAAGPPAKP